ncbi:MAG: C40 family peptidase [Bacteroidota bacterium]
MSAKSLLFSGICLLLLSVGCQNSSSYLTEAEQLAAEIKQSFAPDKRVALWQIEATDKKGQIVVSGQTNLPAAKTAFLEKLTEADISVTDSIEVLPNASLGDQTYGIVNVSVCNIRSKSGHSQELATQSLLGTPIKVLDRHKEWFLVQTPDKYIAWLDHGGFVQVNQNEYREWISAPKVIYTRDFGFSYEKADVNSQKITDLVAGNMLKSVGKEGNFLKVEYPDGRTAFVPKRETLNYDSWLVDNQPDANDILTTAREYLGRPYLWGGTSGKGMDCSGFTKTVFYLNGVQLARDASQQVHTGQLVETDETLKNTLPGDLLFFGRKATAEQKERITHVGIYMGKGEFIHASGDAGVKIESLVPDAPNFNKKRLDTFVKAKRILSSLGQNGVDILADLPSYNPSKL